MNGIIFLNSDLKAKKEAFEVD